MDAAEFFAFAASKMPEKALQEGVRQAAITLGWEFYHTHDSRRSESGFPDCTMVKNGRIIFAELKRQDKNPTAAQQVWLDKLGEAGCEVYVWRPLDMLNGTIPNILRRKP